MTKDPKFLDDAKRLRRDIEIVTGDEIQQIIADIAKVPKDKLAALNGHFKFRGKTEKVVLELLRHTGKIVQIKRGGRKLYIDYNGKKVSASVSGRRTKVSLNGKKVKRKVIKKGMSCTFVYYGSNTRAKEVICTN